MYQTDTGVTDTGVPDRVTGVPDRHVCTRHSHTNVPDIDAGVPDRDMPISRQGQIHGGGGGTGGTCPPNPK